jgi:hypothetical protein
MKSIVLYVVRCNLSHESDTDWNWKNSLLKKFVEDVPDFLKERIDIVSTRLIGGITVKHAPCVFIVKDGDFENLIGCNCEFKDGEIISLIQPNIPDYMSWLMSAINSL